MTPGELLANPTTALWAALVVPLVARFFVAWTVWLRIRGLSGGANLQPQRTRSDYPRPNDPVPAAAVLLLGAIAFAVVASGLGRVVSNTDIPWWAWPVIFGVSAVGSVVYAFRRVREDDRRQRRFLAERLTAETASRAG